MVGSRERAPPIEVVRWRGGQREVEEHAPGANVTAEIAIFNREGIALAADSAVTVSLVSGWREKVYRSAQKIFALQPGVPVAVMVYGNASVMGIPWETILAGYGRQLGDRRFDTVAEYAADLFGYCGGYLEHVEEGELEATVDAIIDAAFEACFERVEDAVVAAGDEDGAAAEAGWVGMMHVLGGEVEREATEAPRIVGLDDDTCTRIEARRRSTVTARLKDIGGARGKDRVVRRLLQQISKLALSRNLEALGNPCSSGLVVAGFGEREIYPSVHVYEMNGILGPTGPGRALDMASERDVLTGAKTPFRAGIYAFAQNRMVRTFFEGIDPGLGDAIFRQLQQVMLEMAGRDRSTTP